MGNEKEVELEPLFPRLWGRREGKPKVPGRPSWMKEDAVRARRYSDARRDWPSECCGSGHFVERVRGAICVWSN